MLHQYLCKIIKQKVVVHDKHIICCHVDIEDFTEM